MTVGSLGPNSADLVEFTTALAPDELTRTSRTDYAQHRGGDGVTRLEALAAPPREVEVPFTLAPIAGAEAPARRLVQIERLRTSRAVCALFLGPRLFGEYVVAEVRERHRDAAGLRIELDVRLLEYDGSRSGVATAQRRQSAANANSSRVAARGPVVLPDSV